MTDTAIVFGIIRMAFMVIITLLDISAMLTPLPPPDPVADSELHHFPSYVNLELVMERLNHPPALHRDF